VIFESEKEAKSFKSRASTRARQISPRLDHIHDPNVLRSVFKATCAVLLFVTIIMASHDVVAICLRSSLISRLVYGLFGSKYCLLTPSTNLLKSSVSCAAVFVPIHTEFYWIDCKPIFANWSIAVSCAPAVSRPCLPVAGLAPLSKVVS